MSVQSTSQSDSKKIYEKSYSFETFVSNLKTDINVQKNRVLESVATFVHEKPDDERGNILRSALEQLNISNLEEPEFKITIPIADELSKIDDEDLPRYIYHRYRYDIYPKKKILDQYSPYLQIEPTSICNYRCVFCYQTDKSFSDKKSGHMGSMSFNTFKKIMDEAQGNVEFFSLASRGEPFICPDIDQMLEYCQGKFLGLKVNTNASLLTEKHCHAILSGGVNTLVFSADAAVEPLYSQLRVNGKLDRVLKNIKMFHDIRRNHYSGSKIITRVSGVKFDTKQSMSSMQDIWGPLVDQICFVDYNPWENVYESPVNDLKTPCSDLWRRMFVWYDGKVNPCDTDFKSELCVGNVLDSSVSDLWRSAGYERLRAAHLDNQRCKGNPCRRCTVI